MYVYYIHRSPLYPPIYPSGDKTQIPATNFAPSVHLPFGHELSGFVRRSGLVVAHTLGKLVHGLTHLDMLNHGNDGDDDVKLGGSIQKKVFERQEKCVWTREKEQMDQQFGIMQYKDGIWATN